MNPTMVRQLANAQLVTLPAQAERNQAARALAKSPALFLGQNQFISVRHSPAARAQNVGDPT
jgi:hypothetical protein